MRFPSLLFGLGAAIVLSVPGTAQAPSGEVRRVRITAERFDFFPSEIKVPLGTTLDLQIESEDTLHGFRIVGSAVNVAIPKRGRGTISVTFQPERAGEYIFECSRMCGAGHNFMRGRIVVQTPVAP